jgi:hypothetical protein
LSSKEFGSEEGPRAISLVIDGQRAALEISIGPMSATLGHLGLLFGKNFIQ